MIERKFMETNGTTDDILLPNSETLEPPDLSQSEGSKKRRRGRGQNDHTEANESKELTHKRGWQSWSTTEKEVFFNSLAEFRERDFDTISTNIGSKNYDQVRHFYYRIIKKVNKILKPSKLDHKNQDEVVNAMLCFWNLKCNSDIEEKTTQFADSLKEMIVSKSLETREKEEIQETKSGTRHHNRKRSNHTLLPKEENQWKPLYPPEPTFDDSTEMEALVKEQKVPVLSSLIQPTSLNSTNSHKPNSISIGQPRTLSNSLAPMSMENVLRTSSHSLLQTYQSSNQHPSSLTLQQSNSSRDGTSMHSMQNLISSTLPNNLSKTHIHIPTNFSAESSLSMSLFDESSSDYLMISNTDEIACKNYYRNFDENSSTSDGYDNSVREGRTSNFQEGPVFRKLLEKDQ